MTTVNDASIWSKGFCHMFWTMDMGVKSQQPAHMYSGWPMSDSDQWSTVIIHTSQKRLQCILMSLNTMQGPAKQMCELWVKNKQEKIRLSGVWIFFLILPVDQWSLSDIGHPLYSTFHHILKCQIKLNNPVYVTLMILISQGCLCVEGCKCFLVQILLYSNVKLSWITQSMLLK